VIQPRAEDARAAQFAAVLVRHDVVRIVGSRTVVAEVAERLAGSEPAGQHPEPAVRHPRRTLVHLLEIELREGALLADQRIEDLRARRDHDCRRIQLGEVDLDRVIAQRVIEAVPMISAPVAISGFDGGSNSI
jgi:hypothetical protein